MARSSSPLVSAAVQSLRPRPESSLLGIHEGQDQVDVLIEARPRERHDLDVITGRPYRGPVPLVRLALLVKEPLSARRPGGSSDCRKRAGGSPGQGRVSLWFCCGDGRRRFAERVPGLTTGHPLTVPSCPRSLRQTTRCRNDPSFPAPELRIHGNAEEQATPRPDIARITGGGPSMIVYNVYSVGYFA